MPETRAPTPDRDPLIGRTIDGRYRVASVLARGGMSRVYRAEQAPLGRTVALKVLSAGGDPEHAAEFRHRFQLEASVCARLTHPNTVRVFDHGQVGDELLYIVMEFLDGRTLHHVIKAEGPLPASRVVNVARQVCGSLREAHGLGLIHRDLKPANVVLLDHGDDEDFVKVLDFGLVKQLRANDELTGTDAVVGSPSYMSPEQIRAERLDARRDIYSLGVILYTAVAGRPPFVADTSVGVLLAHLNQRPPPLDPRSPALVACPTLAWVIDRCLEKSATDRFADVDEVLRALRVCDAELRGEAVTPPTLRDGRLVREATNSQSRPAFRGPVPAPEPSASTVVSAVRSRRGPLLAATGAMMVVVMFGALTVLVGFGAWWWKSRMAPPEPAAPAPVAALAAPAAVPPPVEINVTPAGALLRRNGTVLGTAPLSLAIPHGEVWEVEVSAPGHTATTVRIPWDAVRRQVSLVVAPAGPARKATAKPGTPAPADPPKPASEPAVEPKAPAPKRGADLKDPWDP